MLSNAFKGAYTERVGAEHKVQGNIQAGIRDAATIATIAALGFTGAISDETLIKGVSRMGASRLGGLGGMAVNAALGEKRATAEAKSQDSLEPVFTEASNLSRSEEEDIAIDTVWEILHRGKKVDSK